MLNTKIYCCAFALALSDLFAWALAFNILTLRQHLDLNTMLMALWTFWVLFNNRNYLKRQSFWGELKGVIVGGLTFCLFTVIAGLLYEKSEAIYFYSKLTLLLFVILPLARFVTRYILNYFNVWAIPTIIFGVEENAKQAILALNDESTLGFRVVALMSPTDKKPTLILDTPIKTWPRTKDDFELLKDKQCVIALEAWQSELRDSLIRQLSEHRVDQISVIPAMRGVPLFGLDTTQFFSHEVLMINLKIQLGNPVLRIIKRIFDIIISSILLLILSPVFAYITWKITRDGGSAYFGHERIGRNGVTFKCYKFRSMILNSEKKLQDLLRNDVNARKEWERDFKLKNDPRITSIGHILRRTSLDELPQLWNVLCGQMSLVGPRPVVSEELERYGQDVVYYLMTNPGMTGLWQISGRNDVDYSTRVYFDSWYVKNWSVWTDIAILVKTIAVVFGRKGAY